MRSKPAANGIRLNSEFTFKEGEEDSKQSNDLRSPVKSRHIKVTVHKHPEGIKAISDKYNSLQKSNQTLTKIKQVKMYIYISLNINMSMTETVILIC